MKTTITIEPMQPDTIFLEAWQVKNGEVLDTTSAFEMFIVTTHPTVPTVKTISHFPLTPKEHSALLSTINFGVDFTRKKMQEYMSKQS